MRYDVFGSDLGAPVSQDKLFERTVQDLEKKIEHLKGKDREKDAAICDMVREQIMAAGGAEDLEHLTAALLNMQKVMQE